MVLEHVQHEISVKGTPVANHTNSVHMFKSVDEARKKIEAWRLDYRRRRPHSSLKDVPPEEFLQKCRRPEPLRLAAISGLS